MTYLFAILVVVVFALLLGRWMATAQPAVVARTIRWALIVIVAVALLGIVLAERYQFAGLVLPLLIPVFLRWRGFSRWRKNARGPTPGRTSTINTAFLRMELDHDSGNLDGAVIAGTFGGRRLGDMTIEELLRLHGECRSDNASLRILEAYLDRVHGAAWRASAKQEQATGGDSSSGRAMTREEAYAILGLSAGADDRAVKEAHRRLMASFHPDRGGSNYLAALINRARDLLLGR